MSVESKYRIPCPSAAPKDVADITFYFQDDIGGAGGSSYGFTVSDGLPKSDILPIVLPLAGATRGISIVAEPASFGFGDLHAIIYLNGLIVDDLFIDSPFYCNNIWSILFGPCDQISLQFVSNDMSSWYYPIANIWLEMNP